MIGTSIDVPSGVLASRVSASLDVVSLLRETCSCWMAPLRPWSSSSIDCFSWLSCSSDSAYLRVQGLEGENDARPGQLHQGSSPLRRRAQIELLLAHGFFFSARLRARVRVGRRGESGVAGGESRWDRRDIGRSTRTRTRAAAAS